MASAYIFPNVEERFSTNFRQVLELRYRRVPSAAFVANQFNRHNKADRRISQETARRWLRGLSMPSYQNLQVLTVWLKLEVGTLIESRSVKEYRFENISERRTWDQGLLISDLLKQLPLQTQKQIWDLLRVCPYSPVALR